MSADVEDVDAMLERMSKAVADVIKPVLKAENKGKESPVKYALVLITEFGRVAVISDAPRDAAKETFRVLAQEVPQ